MASTVKASGLVVVGDEGTMAAVELGDTSVEIAGLDPPLETGMDKKPVDRDGKLLTLIDTGIEVVIIALVLLGTIAENVEVELTRQPRASSGHEVTKRVFVVVTVKVSPPKVVVDVSEVVENNVVEATSPELVVVGKGTTDGSWDGAPENVGVGFGVANICPLGPRIKSAES